MNMREKIEQLERKCEEYRQTIARAAERLAQHESEVGR